MTEATQMDLVPRTYPRLRDVDVPLDWLPPDDALVSEPPKKELVDSIREEGLQQPLRLADHERDEDSGRRYEVLAGNRRIKALRILREEWEAKNPGVDPVGGPFYAARALVSEPGDPANTAAASAAMNHTAAMNWVGTMYEVAAMRARDWDEQKIHARAAIPVGTQRRVLRVHDNLRGSLHEGLQRGQIRFTVAEAASKLSRERQGGLVDILRETGRLTGPDVKRARQVAREEAQQNFDFDVLADAPSAEEVIASLTGGGPIDGPTEDADGPAPENDAALSYIRGRVSDVRGALARTGSARWKHADVEAVEEILELAGRALRAGL